MRPDRVSILQVSNRFLQERKEAVHHMLSILRHWRQRLGTRGMTETYHVLQQGQNRCGSAGHLVGGRTYICSSSATALASVALVCASHAHYYKN
jgi:hypothetical protein